MKRSNNFPECYTIIVKKITFYKTRLVQVYEKSCAIMIIYENRVTKLKESNCTIINRKKFIIYENNFKFMSKKITCLKEITKFGRKRKKNKKKVVQLR